MSHSWEAENLLTILALVSTFLAQTDVAIVVGILMRTSTDTIPLQLSAAVKQEEWTIRWSITADFSHDEMSSSLPVMGDAMELLISGDERR